MFHVVSIHALLAECDHQGIYSPLYPLSFNPRTPCGVRLTFSGVRGTAPRFQSTHSLRSATAGLPAAQADAIVSIHALLAECDKVRRHLQESCLSFNPRTPCGVRPLTAQDCPPHKPFQSTHSLRSATDIFRGTGDGTKVSIHALLAECDFHDCFNLSGAGCFNPRTPCGVRRVTS